MDKGFIKVPRSIVDQPWFKSDTALRLYLHLLHKAVFRDISITYKGDRIDLKPGEYWTTQARLAKEIGATKRAIQRALKRLEGFHIECQEIARKGTIIKLTAAIYIEEVPEEVPPDEKTAPLPAPPKGARSKNVISKNVNKNVMKEYSCAFLDFWNAYPKRLDKSGCFKIWARNELDSLLPTILGALEHQKKSAQWCKDEGQFIPHPSTWLNQKRWEQEQDLLADHSDELDFQSAKQRLIAKGVIQ